MEAPRLLRGMQRVAYRQRTQLGFHSYTWVHLWTFRAALVTIGFGNPLHSFILDSAQYDFAAPPLPSLSQLVPHPAPYVLHSQIDATPLLVIAPIQTSKDAHARMDRLEQKIRQMRVLDGAISWNDFDGAPVANLPSHFRMPEIKRYMGIAPRPVPQPVPPQFRMDAHYAYHQSPRHDTDCCSTLRHAMQDLIDQGLVNLGQPSLTTNPLPAHSTHVVPPPRAVSIT
ncbi:hypothetical protein CK203_093809 [Vitis vinifera]|uniref:Uncharacterized protein n=1 Tax=Vitis vinifera TaxID=29760 RepID=A0A438C7R5_VITVI|nr:hypothetical protein CK203_093809 [Vitis vinifera]